MCYLFRIGGGGHQSGTMQIFIAWEDSADFFSDTGSLHKFIPVALSVSFLGKMDSSCGKSWCLLDCGRRENIRQQASEQ